MPLQNSTSETLATTQHWMRLIRQRDNSELLPHRFSIDTLVFLARVLVMYRTDALYAGEMRAVRELMSWWIERLLVAQDAARLRTFRRHAKVLR